MHVLSYRLAPEEHDVQLLAPDAHVAHEDEQARQTWERSLPFASVGTYMPPGQAGLQTELARTLPAVQAVHVDANPVQLRQGGVQSSQTDPALTKVPAGHAPA